MIADEITLKSFLASLLTPIVKDAIREEVAKLSITQTTVASPANRLGGVDLAMEVTGKAESTIYNLVHQNKIPHSKQAGKLYFSEVDLLDWIQQGKRQTRQGVAAEVDSFLGSRKGGRRAV